MSDDDYERAYQKAINEPVSSRNRLFDTLLDKIKMAFDFDEAMHYFINISIIIIAMIVIHHINLIDLKKHIYNVEFALSLAIYFQVIKSSVTTLYLATISILLGFISIPFQVDQYLMKNFFEYLQLVGCVGFVLYAIKN